MIGTYSMTKFDSAVLKQIKKLYSKFLSLMNLLRSQILTHFRTLQILALALSIWYFFNRTAASLELHRGMQIDANLNSTALSFLLNSRRFFSPNPMLHFQL